MLGPVSFLESADLSVSQLDHLVATFEALAPFGANHPQGRRRSSRLPRQGHSGDDLARSGVDLACGG